MSTAMAYNIGACHGCRFALTDEDAVVCTARTVDLAQVLGDAPTYYQCIPWMLWQYTAHEPEVRAAILTTFICPCLYVSQDVQ